MGGALVEHHHDVGPKILLDFNHPLRSEHVRGAVRVRLECDSGLPNGAQVSKTEHLETAAVGQNQARPPAHECMESSEPGNHFCSGTEMKVVGIGKNAAGSGVH